MSWHFSQALAAEFSAANCSAGERFAPSKSKLTLSGYLSNDRMTAFSRRSLFGMTFEPLTESLGEELLTWFRAGFPVKTSAAQPIAGASKQELTEKEAGCGENSPELLAKYDLDSSSWKIPRSSENGDWIESSPTLPSWGTMRNGACWAAPILELGIAENGSGFSLPTISKTEYKGAPKNRFRGSSTYRGSRMSEGLRICETDPAYVHPNFAEQAMGWPDTWTESQPLETGKFQSWLQLHGIFCEKESE